MVFVKGPPCAGKTHLLCHAIQRLGGVGGGRGGAQVPTHSSNSAASQAEEGRTGGEEAEEAEKEADEESTPPSSGWKMVFLHHTLDDTALLSRSK
jgi:hypothetical protein